MLQSRYDGKEVSVADHGYLRDPVVAGTGALPNTHLSSGTRWGHAH